MPTSPIGEQQLASLRCRASSRLTGNTSATAAPFAASDALAVLLGLAATPDTADDALTLLHELQVHQVELELQAEDLRESRTELEAMLRRQIALYDLLPVGCFTIDRSLSLHELNRQGAAMLGVMRDEAYTLCLSDFLDAGSVRALEYLLAGITPGSGISSAPLRLKPRAGAQRVVRADVGPDTDENRFLVVLTTLSA